MIKYIDRCTSYFGYGFIKSNIHARVCEFEHPELADETERTLMLRERELFGEFIKNRYAGKSCYLFIKNLSLSRIQSKYLNLYGLSKFQSKFGWAEQFGINKSDCNKLELWGNEDENTIAIIEYAISRIEQVFKLLERYSFSAIAVIFESNRTDHIYRLIDLYSKVAISETINTCCALDAAVLTCICGNDGMTFNCFFAKAV